VLIGALESSGDIVSVSSCDNEIFILKGDREIIRLSNNPEGTASTMLSAHLSSPLTTPTILQPTGSVETVQPIRTMAIIVEGGGKEEAGGNERLSEEGTDEEGEEEGVEEVEEAVEQESPPKAMKSSQPSTLFSSSRFRSSSVTAWDSLSAASPGTTPVSTTYELSSRRYSAPIDEERMQQKLVVKPIRVKKKKKRHQGK
ncbi:hypothetical protein XENOCAPTIV_013162, partial [Xenoophorus captivus]